MLEKRKSSVDKGRFCGTLLTDLCKGFDCFDHELLIGKFSAYGFSLHVLRLIHYYFSSKKQRARTGNSYSSWFDIIFRVNLEVDIKITFIKYFHCRLISHFRKNCQFCRW